MNKDTSRRSQALLFRPPHIDDAVAYFDFLNDRRVSIWLEDECQRPLMLANVQSFIGDGGWARWAIDYDQRFIGLAGLENPDLGRGVARLFIVIGKPELWGKGLGTEILTEVVRRGFLDFGLRKISADILAPNKPSLRIHEKVGFSIEGRLRQDAWREGRWVDRVLLSILADEFEPDRSGEGETHRVGYNQED